MFRLAPAPLLAALLVMGCADGRDYPSLAPRPIEKIETADAPAAVPTAAAAEAEVAQRLKGIEEAADAGHAGFLAEMAGARAAIDHAEGSAPGSESWVAGQVALSRAESARGALLSALADLDALRRELSGSSNPANIAILDQAAQRLAAIDTQESASLKELTDKLP